MIQLLFGHTDDYSQVIFQADEVTYRFPKADIPTIIRSLRALCDDTATLNDQDLRVFLVPPDVGYPAFRIGLAEIPAVLLISGYRIPSPAYVTSFGEAATIADKLERLHRTMEAEAVRH